MIRFTDICLVTSDVPRQRAFYEKVFGVAGEGDENHAGVRLGGLAVTLDSVKMLRDTGTFAYTCGQSSDNTILGFDVEDVDAEYERLLALGVETLNEPTAHPWGARSFQFRDPDGNILNFRTVIKEEDSL